jgi:hypothetical protein
MLLRQRERGEFTGDPGVNFFCSSASQPDWPGDAYASATRGASQTVLRNIGQLNAAIARPVSGSLMALHAPLPVERGGLLEDK